jgi:hypothetical protein
MPKLKSLKVAHEDIKQSLEEWLRAKESFEDKRGWPEEDLSPYYIRPRINVAVDIIHASVRRLSHSLDRVSSLVGSIQRASANMGKAVRDGTSHTLDYSEHSKVLGTWKDVCGDVDSFARSAARELKGLQSKYRDASDSALLYYASLGLENTAEDAMKCSKRISNRRNRERSEKFSNRRNFED